MITPTVSQPACELCLCLNWPKNTFGSTLTGNTSITWRYCLRKYRQARWLAILQLWWRQIRAILYSDRNKEQWESAKYKYKYDNASAIYNKRTSSAQIIEHSSTVMHRLLILFSWFALVRGKQRLVHFMQMQFIQIHSYSFHSLRFSTPPARRKNYRGRSHQCDPSALPDFHRMDIRNRVPLVWCKHNRRWLGSHHSWLRCWVSRNSFIWK